MTLFSPVSFFHASHFHEKEAALKQPKYMRAIALMFFLLFFLTSNLVHADHLIEQATQVEQSECYICHQGLDTPPKLPQVQAPFINSYYLASCEESTVQFKRSSFVQPQLRAPPVIL